MALSDLVSPPRLAAIGFLSLGVDSARRDFRGLELARQLQRVESNIDMLFAVLKDRRKKLFAFDNDLLRAFVIEKMFGGHMPVAPDQIGDGQTLSHAPRHASLSLQVR